MENKNEQVTLPMFHPMNFLQGFLSGDFSCVPPFGLQNYPMTSFIENKDYAEVPKKRGRKKLRPNNPTKTEVMDKFWLRGFREFMKINYLEIRPMIIDFDFWDEFLGRHGIPGKRSQFLSYSKAYKESLFANEGFAKMFVAWAYLYGVMKVPRKNFKGSWESYYEYLFVELVAPCKTVMHETSLKEAMEVLNAIIQKNLLYSSCY